MKIRPLHDRVMVKRLERNVPLRRHRDSRHSGREAGAGKDHRGRQRQDSRKRLGPSLDVKVGDKILFGKYSGTEVKVDGEELVVMREEDVMAVIEGK